MQLHRARKDFDEAGIRLAVIGMGTPEQAADFRKVQGVDLPLLIDNERRTYALAGTKVATIDELLGPRVIARGIKHTIKSRLRLGSM